MANKPKKSLESAAALHHQKVMRVLNREFTKFFADMLTPEPGWTRPSDEQFIEAVAQSLVAVGNTVREGRGLAMLQTFVYDLQDLINSDVLGDLAAAELAPPAIVKKLPQPVKPKSSVPVIEKEYEVLHPWDFSGASGFGETSPLFRLGYSVAEGRLLVAVRREILQTVMSENNLPGVKTAEDKKRWGKPDSAQRLYAVTKFLTWLSNFQGVEKPAARKKWMSDLEFLKREFYREDMPFVWPTIDAEGKMQNRKRTPDAAFMKALTLSKELAAVLGTNPLPRTEIVSKLWAYIKANGLQDNVKKRMINADEKLRAVFGKDQVSMFEMAGLIGKHVR